MQSAVSQCVLGLLGDGLKTDLEGRVEKDGWLSKPSALSNVGVRRVSDVTCCGVLAASLCTLASDYNSSRSRQAPLIERTQPCLHSKYVCSTPHIAVQFPSFSVLPE